MRTILRQLGLLLSAAVTLVVAAACETSSHKSVRTYDYRDDGRAQRPAADDDDDDDRDSDYHMVSPGEMAAPGRPVVDPKP